ncbi:MAG: hypothetical protein IJH87_02520, partial [Atopobiaceae bacterium]|nr:hypothetical protein [Atopobiaceae bacterium]
MSDSSEPVLWTRDFSLVTFATVLGAAGGIAGEFALAFFVFDETGSTLAAALVIAVTLIPHTVVPLAISPFMDRLPRKAFLVAGDAVCGLAYAALGMWLAFFEFSYAGYLVASLLLACLEAVDELAWTSLYPEVIPVGAEQKGYAVSSMLYTTLSVVMTPFAAVLLDTIGVPRLLMINGALAAASALIESFVRVEEHEREEREENGLELWLTDIRESLAWLKDEPGMRGIMGYQAVSNGIASGYSPILIAFVRTTPGFSAATYGFCAVAECLGRTMGSLIQYRVEVPKERRFGLCFLVYVVYDIMDACLLWLSYPLMLANRAVCGFLGSNSLILRESATQRYIPEH